MFAVKVPAEKEATLEANTLLSVTADSFKEGEQNITVRSPLKFISL